MHIVTGTLTTPNEMLLDEGLARTDWVWSGSRVKCQNFEIPNVKNYQYKHQNFKASNVKISFSGQVRYRYVYDSYVKTICDIHKQIEHSLLSRCSCYKPIHFTFKKALDYYYKCPIFNFSISKKHPNSILYK